MSRVLTSKYTHTHTHTHTHRRVEATHTQTTGPSGFDDIIWSFPVCYSGQSNYSTQLRGQTILTAEYMGIQREYSCRDCAGGWVQTKKKTGKNTVQNQSLFAGSSDESVYYSRLYLFSFKCSINVISPSRAYLTLHAFSRLKKRT